MARFHKHGGMYFFRWGRFGGSIYLARASEANSREDFQLARLATMNLAVAAWFWTEALFF